VWSEVTNHTRHVACRCSTRTLYSSASLPASPHHSQVLDTHSDSLEGIMSKCNALWDRTVQLDAAQYRGTSHYAIRTPGSPEYEQPSCPSMLHDPDTCSITPHISTRIPDCFHPVTRIGCIRVRRESGAALPSATRPAAPGVPWITCALRQSATSAE
jgi:hypothetical protein